MPADTDKAIKFQIKYLNTNAGDLSDNDLEWVIKMEESLNKKGFLSKREQEILTDIFKRY
jgi:hypothetical protein